MKAFKKNLPLILLIAILLILSELILSKVIFNNTNNSEGNSLLILVISYLINAGMRSRAFRKAEKKIYWDRASKLLAIFSIVQLVVFTQIESGSSKVFWSTFTFFSLLVSDYILANTLRKKSIQTNQKDGK